MLDMPLSHMCQWTHDVSYTRMHADARTDINSKTEIDRYCKSATAPHLDIFPTR